MKNMRVILDRCDSYDALLNAEKHGATLQISSVPVVEWHDFREHQKEHGGELEDFPAERYRAVLESDETLQRDATRYRFMRCEDNWGDDSDGSTSWEALGESSMQEFDQIVDKRLMWAQEEGHVELGPGTKSLPFQRRVKPWLTECFGDLIAGDREERNHRFLEEALELVQACDCTADEAHKLVDYVFGRPVGDPFQEVGGVRVTLAALCLANGLNEDDCAETELQRITQPDMVVKIREKQKTKPAMSPLPGVYPEREES